MKAAGVREAKRALEAEVAGLQKQTMYPCALALFTGHLWPPLLWLHEVSGHAGRQTGASCQGLTALCGMLGGKTRCVLLHHEQMLREPSRTWAPCLVA